MKSVRTDCGSHTHTVLPEKNRLIVYVSSYDIAAGRFNCEGPHDQISVVEIPRKDPSAAAVVNEPVLFPDGGNDGTSGTLRATTGCHDITVYQAIDLAAGACTGQGVIIDISDPVNPEVISSVEDENFAFWHSATISQNGKRVLFTDEKGGGSGAECNPTVGPERGADAIYDITDPSNPQFMSYFKIPRTQTNEENCVAHNGNALPVRGRDILIQSWYQGGISVVDWTNGFNPRELGWFDRGPIDPTRRRARRLLVVVLLQRPDLRQRDPARLRRVRAARSRVPRGRARPDGHAERPDAVRSKPQTGSGAALGQLAAEGLAGRLELLERASPRSSAGGR